MILKLLKQMNKCEGTFAIKNVNTSVMEVLQMTGFTDLITIIEN